jgi:hypothetical protein
MSGAERTGAPAGVEPWDTEWAAERAAEALRYLGSNYPECIENPRVLDEHEEAANEAALLGDREGYLEALRGFCSAGRETALEIRRGGVVRRRPRTRRAPHSPRGRIKHAEAETERPPRPMS